MCAAYLLTLLPSRGGVDGDCPYQLFHGRTPSIDNLKVFGCAAYGLIPSQIRNTKLGDTSVLCVMVGYDDTRKAYRLFNPNNFLVVVSASCRFDETTFPFRQEGFGKVQQLMPKAIGVTPAVPGAMGGSLKQIKDADDSPKEQKDNHVRDVKELTAVEAAIKISSDEQVVILNPIMQI